MIGWVVTDNAHFAKHAGGDGFRIIDFDRIDLAQLDTPSGHQTEDVGARIMYHERRPARANDRRDFAENAVGGFVEANRMTEDFADRIDQIDFLIPARQLGGDLAGFFFGAHHGTDHFRELDRLPLATAIRPDLEPGIRHRRNRLKPGGTVGSLESTSSSAVGLWRPAWLFAAFPETATDLE